MRVTVEPQVRFGALPDWSLAVDGEALTICGTAVDLSGVAEGEEARDLHPLLVKATRRGGEVVALVVKPIPPDAPAQDRASATPFPGDPEAEAAAVLAAWRAGASLPRADFALATLAAGLITAEEAEAWASGQAVPAVVASAIGTLPEGERTEARIRALATANIRRAHPLIALIATHMDLTDAQVDALFGTPPA